MNCKYWHGLITASCPLQVNSQIVIPSVVFGARNLSSWSGNSMKLKIFEKDIEILCTQFQKQFEILVKNNELFWRIDGRKLPHGKGGVIHIWIRREVDGYHLVFVRPDWLMIIDGQSYPLNLYHDIRIDEHTLELKYKSYRFVCWSDQTF